MTYLIYMLIFQFARQQINKSPEGIPHDIVGEYDIINQPAFSLAATAHLGRSLDKAAIHHVDNAINGHLGWDQQQPSGWCDWGFFMGTFHGA